MKYLYIFLVVCLFACLNASAQNKAVSGYVYAFKDLRLKNIAVEAKKSGAAVLTDSLGHFSIICAAKDKLSFTAKGFRKVVVNVNKKERVEVKMVLLDGAKNEEIAVQSGHVSRYQIDYAISHHAVYNNDYGTYTSIFDLIQGKFAGVEVVSVGSTKYVRVRGVSSSGNNNAIYVVNGTMMPDISHIEPINVKSIDVIKDGNAFYGAHGANGVVLITTIDGAENLR